MTELSSRIFLAWNIFACNILAFKLIYEGFDGVSTCKYFYLVVCYFQILLMVYLLYLLITRRTSPRRKLYEKSSGEKQLCEEILNPLCTVLCTIIVHLYCHTELFSIYSTFTTVLYKFIEYVSYNLQL